MGLRRILHKYNLPGPMTLLDNPVSKTNWKKQIKERVHQYWRNRIINDCQLYSSLNYLNVEAYQPGQIHQILKITGNPARESTRLATKLKVVTDTYILQSKRARFSNTEKGAQCLLCEEADETVEHFILKCRVLEPIRQNSIETIESLWGFLFDPQRR